MSVAVERALHDDRRALPPAFAAALAILGLAIFSAHRREPSLGRPDAAPAPIEAELLHAQPNESHLAEPAVVPKAKRAAAVVRKLDRSAPAATTAPPRSAAPEPEAPADNETAPTRAAIANHGPVVTSGPAPQLPSYLRDQNLKASALIEFTIETDGTCAPRLISSSGNDELDAIALKAARGWRFSPAIQDNHPVRSTARLRLNFEVK